MKCWTAIDIRWNLEKVQSFPGVWGRLKHTSAAINQESWTTGVHEAKYLDGGWGHFDILCHLTHCNSFSCAALVVWRHSKMLEVFVKICKNNARHASASLWSRNELMKQTALKCCTVTEMQWCRKEVSYETGVTVIWWPNLDMNATPSRLKGPTVLETHNRRKYCGILLCVAQQPQQQMPDMWITRLRKECSCIGRFHDRWRCGPLVRGFGQTFRLFAVWFVLTI